VDSVVGPLRRAGEWLDALLPASCHGCGDPLPPRTDHAVCVRCRLRLRRAPAPRCPRCDHPARWALGRCPGCEPLPDLVRHVRCAVLHRPPADALVRALKYDGWQDLASFMAGRMLPLVPEGSAGLVPVASPPRRERRRGFNPARTIARALSNRSGVPVVEAIRRPREARRQVGLSPDERVANLRNAFVPSARFPGIRGTLVLVDDVLTTGATAAAAATALGVAGACRVDVLTFARAVPTLPDGVDVS
jgi:ComF family protein